MLSSFLLVVKFAIVQCQITKFSKIITKATDGISKVLFMLLLQRIDNTFLSRLPGAYLTYFTNCKVLVVLRDTFSVKIY